MFLPQRTQRDAEGRGVAQVMQDVRREATDFNAKTQRRKDFGVCIVKGVWRVAWSEMFLLQRTQRIGTLLLAEVMRGARCVATTRATRGGTHSVSLRLCPSAPLR